MAWGQKFLCGPSVFDRPGRRPSPGALTHAAPIRQPASPPARQPASPPARHAGWRGVAPRQPVARGVAWGSAPRIDRRSPGVTWCWKCGWRGVARKQSAHTFCMGYPTLPGCGRGAAGAVPWGSWGSWGTPLKKVPYNFTTVYIYSINTKHFLDTTYYPMPPHPRGRLHPAPPTPLSPTRPTPPTPQDLSQPATSFAWGSRK